MNIPVRVLQVVRPASGGIRQHLETLLSSMDPAQVTNSVAAPPALLEIFRGSPNCYGAIPLEIAPRIALSDLHCAWRLSLVQAQADLVHAHGLRAAWVAALAHCRRPFPLLFTAHNAVGRSLPTRLAVSFISRRCTKIVAVSSAVAESLVANGADRAKMVVIPNGIAVDHFAVDAQTRTDARRTFSLSEKTFVVAAAARFSVEKGLDLLLKAAASRPGMRFLIAGDGPLFAALSKGLPPNVQLLGRLGDVRPLLAAADVFAVPSRREGQGIAALEALAAGLPIAAARVGGLAEMLTDGETALLVPADDSVALAAALSRLQSDPRLRRTLSANGTRLVHSRYRLEEMLAALVSLYQETGT